MSKQYSDCKELNIDLFSKSIMYFTGGGSMNDDIYRLMENKITNNEWNITISRQKIGMHAVCKGAIN